MLDARSPFKNGDLGWHNRPPARVRCPTCSAEFSLRYPIDVLDCSTCSVERPPTEFHTIELFGFVCPACQPVRETGIRHPNVFDLPQWGFCSECQHHWEFGHDFR